MKHQGAGTQLFVMSMARGAESLNNQSKWKKSPCFYHSSYFFLDYISSFLLKKLGDIFQIFPKWASKLCFNHTLSGARPQLGTTLKLHHQVNPSISTSATAPEEIGTSTTTFHPTLLPSHPGKIFGQWQYLINTSFYEEPWIIDITQKKPRKQGGQNVSVHSSEQFHSAAQNFLEVPSYLRMVQSQKRLEETYSSEWRKMKKKILPVILSQPAKGKWKTKKYD